MQDTYLTREQLYELVWAEPVRTVAAQIGISDVALAKACRKIDVPLPERGYWAKLQAGKSVTKAKLRPGDLYTDNRARFWSKPQPEFLDRLKAIAKTQPQTPVEELTRRLKARLGEVTTPRNFNRCHRAIQALLDKDEAARRSPNSWDRPTYDSFFQRRRLRFLNGLFLGMAKVGGNGRISGYEGSTIRLQIGPHQWDATLDTRTGGRGQKFAPTWSKETDIRRLVFAINVGAQYPGIVTSWQDENDTPLEDRVTEIIVGLGVATEEISREASRRHEEWKRQYEAEQVEAALKARVEAERREKERLAAEAKARLDALLEDADNLGRAERIRSYVEQVLENPPDGVGTGSLAQWADYARRQASRIDPRSSGRWEQSLREAELDTVSRESATDVPT